MSKKFELPEIVNRKSKFNFEFIETYKAGMVLTGTEIKSIKEGKVNMGDSFCYFKNGELWLKSLHISVYKNGSYANHEPMRLRKLLLTKKEMRKLEGKIKEKGLTIIPYKIFFNERGIAKIEIALARGKKAYDKRETIKERDTAKELQRVKKSYRY
ncbi:MAG: SsrA-binding protein SmpB [Chitinophagales bacterium]|nr:SsrA-binding protein SmpB [Bacteroidota bacterium]